jgi:CheY-like chemotaxis protein
MSGYEANVAYDGESALAQCEACQPDLVISDVVMPGMSGVDLAVSIQQRYSGCKILLFSGQAATADILDQARKRGYSFDVLAKPIHPEDLLSKLVPSAESRTNHSKLNT